MGRGELAMGRGELALGLDYLVVWLSEQAVGRGDLDVSVELAVRQGDRTVGPGEMGVERVGFGRGDLDVEPGGRAMGLGDLAAVRGEGAVGRSELESTPLRARGSDVYGQRQRPRGV